MRTYQKRKKVLIIQSLIPHYRIPIFNELAKVLDLTVMYDKGNVPTDAAFDTKKIEVRRIKGIPKIHLKNMLSEAKKYDVVISMLDGSYLTTHLLCYFRRKTKLILWGIGVAAGYKIRYDSSPEDANGYRRLIHKADAALFYSQYPVEKYINLGIPAEKLFVANNTVKVLPTVDAQRENILFVGTLHKAKKIFELLKCYGDACERSAEIPKLIIVGDGEDGSAVRKWVSDHSLDDRIVLKGAIFDEKELSELFSRAILCVSPDQAGLTVLQSFGYGVPFVTHKNAITGGERNNIINRENGILLDSFEEMTTIFRECAENAEPYLAMGKKAKQFYEENRTVDHMVKGFLDAIAFVSKQ
jgi:glycosyltransferase involved in cell wall biosynthesis